MALLMRAMCDLVWGKNSKAILEHTVFIARPIVSIEHNALLIREAQIKKIDGIDCLKELDMSLREDGFWEKHYAAELKSYEEDGCESDVWFGKGLSRRIANWISEYLSKQPTNKMPTKVLDVGCGNAFTLISLVERLPGSADNLEISGIDYSKSSVDLGKKILSDKGLSGRIRLEQCDFLNLDQVKAVAQDSRFDFIIDVGTYDAICLLAGSALMETKLNYMKSIDALVKDGSIFILASCNHTEEELLILIGRDFRLIDRIESPKLTFGGKEGSQVNCIVVQSNENSANTVA